MTRKRLPKAITRPSGARQDTNEDAITLAPRKSRPSARSASKPVPSEEPPAPQSAPPHDTAEPASAPARPSPPMEGELLPAVSIHAEPQAAQRRAIAAKVVERYKLYAALGGMSVMPVLNIAGVMAVILRLVKTLSNLYGVPFERERTRSIIVGLMGGTVPTGLGVAAASTLALVIPGVGFLGVAVSALTAAELTGRIGLVFVERFEGGATPPAVSQGEA